MQLTDNEKRDVIKYLEAGKPLPEKYRFLLFNDDREVELVWNGKTNEVTNVVLPFQTIEQIDEPRSDVKFGNQNSLFDSSGRQITGWTNKLIWGDNKLILSSLKNGPMRKEIEAQGGLKLIYIDPPFDVGADFSLDIEIGEGDDAESFTKKPSVIEEIAYRDTWGKGVDSFMAMIYERLKLMHGLLAEDGSIFIHCDGRVNGYMRLVLDEIFGKDNFLNEIIWCYRDLGGGRNNDFYKRKHDTIFWYSKSSQHQINEIGRGQLSEETIKVYGRHFIDGKLTYQRLKEVYPKTFETRVLQGRVPKNLDEVWLDSSSGKQLEDWWIDINPLRIRKREADLKEEHLYPTQKPEELIKRIIETVSKPNDLIADFFCGSGTTLSVAEKLGRKWIGSDLGKFGIHTSRKRLLGVQRELKKEGKNFRAFEVLNVGKYERNAFLTTNIDLRVEEKLQQVKKKEREFVNLIVTAYKAELIESFVNLVAKKRDRLVAVGPIDMPVSSKFIQDVVTECKEKGMTKIDVLGFDYEMGMDFSEYQSQGIDIVFKIIPREVFDKKAVEKGQVKFYDVAFIEVKPIIAGKGSLKELSIELTDFSVFYNQDDLDVISEGLRPGGTKVIVSNGQVVKLSKDKQSDIVTPEVLTKKWSDWIDYWAADFDFASRKEIIKIVEGGVEKEVWTGDYIFDNEWQSFRTKKNRDLELTSAIKEVAKGTYKVAVRVVDIFGNDTTKVIEVTI